MRNLTWALKLFLEKWAGSIIGAMKIAHPFSPRKHLGQNFLVDPKIKEKIILSCELKKDEEVIEIGPGLGHLTEGLLPQVKKIYAIEKDPRYSQELKKRYPPDRLEVIETDILKFDLSKLPAGLKVIGNLPYYISTPIIERFIVYREAFPECFFTVQKEFAERLAAKPGTKAYGSLSCFIQYYSDVKILFKIPAGAFRPAPKVTSCFIRILFRPPAIQVADEQKLFKLIRTAFSQRRKKISNSIKTLFHRDLAEAFSNCGLSGKERAEDLSLKNYVDLVERL